MQVDNLLVDAPESWEAQTSLLLREPGGGGFRTNIQIGTRPVDRAVSLQVVGMTHEKTLLRDVGEAQVEQKGLVDVGGRPAYLLDYRFVVAEAEMAQVQYFTTVAGRLVSLTGTSRADRHDELRAQMEAVVGSLRPAE